ncbi:MAG: Lrp/AsnC family transcriptional regulator [Halobacteriales archaeon]
MVTAYVMIKALSGDADRLKQDVEAVEGVQLVHIVAGDVDLIAKLKVDSPTDVKEIAANRIHQIEGVDSTQTYIAME